MEILKKHKTIKYHHDIHKNLSREIVRLIYAHPSVTEAQRDAAMQEKIDMFRMDCKENPILDYQQRPRAIGI